MSGETSCSISGFLATLTKHNRKVMEAGRKALDRAGEHILGQAQKLAPVDTGALKASATSEPAKVQGGGFVKVIGFNTDYAAAVHERMDLHHPQGQSKFLETAIRVNQQRLQSYVVEAMKKEQAKK